MRVLSMDVMDYKKGLVGITNTKEIVIERVEDVLKGEDLNSCLEYMAKCEKGQCHYNSGMAYELEFVLKGWDIYFCEGVVDDAIDHCWNCLVNKTTFERHYVDFTLDKSRYATLFMEWSMPDITKLFCACKFAFIPFRSWFEYFDNKKAKALLLKYYPNLENIYKQNIAAVA